jgi:hypothetical protein
MNIGGMVLGQGIYIKFRPRPFNMINGFLAPRSIWAPLPTPNSTLYLRFSNYLLVKASAQKSQKWTLCLDGNDEMGYSIHCAVDTDLKSAKKLILWDIWHFISSTNLKIGLQYSPLVKVAHGHAKVIYVATVNDGFNIGSTKIWAYAFWRIIRWRILWQCSVLINSKYWRRYGPSKSNGVPMGSLGRKGLKAFREIATPPALFLFSKYFSPIFLI